MTAQTGLTGTSWAKEAGLEKTVTTLVIWSSEGDKLILEVEVRIVSLGRQGVRSVTKRRQKGTFWESSHVLFLHRVIRTCSRMKLCTCLHACCNRKKRKKDGWESKGVCNLGYWGISAKIWEPSILRAGRVPPKFLSPLPMLLQAPLDLYKPPPSWPQSHLLHSKLNI